MTDDDARLTAGALSRRRLLQFGLAAVPFSAVVLAACQPTKKAAPGCVLSPQMTEGPFYLNLGRVRSNITEGRPGLPLLLAFTVVNVNANCAPIANAAVDIWHTDALGAYSGVAGSPGTTFMRGIQQTDANGTCTFQTVYPGWYAGRAVHIHVKVHVGGNTVHTGQLFFADSFTDAVYANYSPYNTRGPRTTLNSNDGIYQNGGAASTLSPQSNESGLSASKTVGVRS